MAKSTHLHRSAACPQDPGDRSRSYLNNLDPADKPRDDGRKDAQNGFTLIEILIVIVIISIISSIAVLSIGINKDKQLDSISDQLINILTLAEQEALLEPATIGFVLTPNSFQFYTYSPKGVDESPWEAITGSTLGTHHLPNDVQITLKVQDKPVKGVEPKLILSPSGDITPFVLYIGRKGIAPRYKIIGTANGNIKKERADEKK